MFRAGPFVPTSTFGNAYTYGLSEACCTARSRCPHFCPNRCWFDCRL